MRTRTTRGFTLVELLLAISIIVLVVGIIVPMVRMFTGSGGVDNAVNEIKGYLLMARQQSIQYHQDIAVFFLPPTELTQNSRMMVFEQRERLINANDLADIRNWQVMPAGYGVNLRRGLEVVNRSGDKLFCVIYNSNGYVDSRCPLDNTCIRIGPKSGTESAERAQAVAISRATGSILQFERRR